MISKKYLIAIFIVLFLLSSGVIHAEDATPTATLKTGTETFFNISDITQLFKEASSSAARQQTQLANIIKGADMMIANRITTLNNLISRIQGDTKLTADEKTSLTTDIQNAISGLTSLKATVDTDTDPVKARTDAKQIVTSFRIYEILEPKLRLLVTLNNLQTTTSNIQALVPQVQNLNIPGFAPFISDVSAQLTTINTTITTDLAALNGVSVTSTNAQAIFTQIRTDLSQIIKTGFGKIRSDFQGMRAALK